MVSTRFYNSHRFVMVSEHEINLSRFDLPTFSPSMCICLFLKAEHCSAQTDDFCRVFGIGTSWNQCWNWYKLKPILKLGQVETNTEIGTSWNQYWNWYKLKPILIRLPDIWTVVQQIMRQGGLIYMQMLEMTNRHCYTAIHKLFDKYFHVKMTPCYCF